MPVLYYFWPSNTFKLLRLIRLFMRNIQTSESVGRGHPDKICDIISDSILDALLEQDENSRVAVETWVKDNQVGLIGEVTSDADIDYEKIVSDTLSQIGYGEEEWGINPKTCKIHNYIGKQSQEISQGVDNDGAGDQGIMWGYATNETKEYLPLSQVLANKLLKKLGGLVLENDFLRPDMKSQVTMVDGKVGTIVLAVQHDEIISEKDLKTFLKKEVIDVVCKDYITPNTTFILNGTGKFTVGGPKGDAGLTGRKIIVDTYGGIGRHGGGAFSGKDPSKVDRSAAYMARHIAKNLVAKGVGDEVEVQLSYCIGLKKPMSVIVDVDGERASDDVYQDVLRYPLEPAKIIDYLNLKKPLGWSYKDTASFGHFGNETYPWEKIK